LRSCGSCCSVFCIVQKAAWYTVLYMDRMLAAAHNNADNTAYSRHWLAGSYNSTLPCNRLHQDHAGARTSLCVMTGVSWWPVLAQTSLRASEQPVQECSRPWPQNF
jgi:hypothetical protein